MIPDIFEYRESNATRVIFDTLRIMMPNRAFASGMAFVAGMVLSGMLEPGVALLGILMIISTYSSQAVFNNIRDVDGDMVNAPGRPLVNGSLSVQYAWAVMGLLIAFGFLFAYLASPFLVLVNIAFIGLGIVYSAFTKSRWYLSYPTLTTSHLVLPLLAGYLVFGSMDIRLMIIVSFIYLTEAFIWSIKDYKDVEGDRQMGVLSLPVILSPRKSAIVTFATLSLPLLFAWLPWHVLGLSTIFLAIYLLCGAIRAYLGHELMKNQSPETAADILKNFRYVLFLQMIAWCLA
jgi:chlorophyll/bacteriochlorophyll a synthase